MRYFYGYFDRIPTLSAAIFKAFFSNTPAYREKLSSASELRCYQGEISTCGSNTGRSSTNT